MHVSDHTGKKLHWASWTTPWMLHDSGRSILQTGMQTQIPRANFKIVISLVSAGQTNRSATGAFLFKSIITHCYAFYFYLFLIIHFFLKYTQWQCILSYDNSTAM
jgi:hypothetical protein